MPTNISWTDESWNPVTGCSKVSAGCAHCYAEKMAHRFGGDFSKVTLHLDRLDIPLHWRRPRMVFVPSMGDLFHEDVPGEFIDKVFAVMALSGSVFQALTKRISRAHAYLSDPETIARIDVNSAAIEAGRMITEKDVREFVASVKGDASYQPVWPLPNVWLMVSAENQKATWRIEELMRTPAAVRGVSLEPLLGPLDLRPWLRRAGNNRVTPISGPFPGDAWYEHPYLDWVIVGGESGGPPERRLVERCDEVHACGVHCRYCLEDSGWRPKPEQRRWVQDIRDQCQAAGVPFFFKQWGPRAGQGTLVDGVEHKGMPEVRA